MINIVNLFNRKLADSQKISMVTCYDYTFARLISKTAVDCILVGDSLGMVIQGNETTLPVTMDDMVYHCRAVRRGVPDKPVIGDMPFLSTRLSIEEGILNAGRLLAEGGCHAVKLEGADPHTLELVKRLTSAGIPVMGHLGFTPQSVQIQGVKVQGKQKSSHKQYIKQATELEKAGAFAVLLEMVPADLGKKITRAVGVPTIGIGAGKDTTGQVLVLYDLLGMDQDFNPRHLKKYLNLAELIPAALDHYASEVSKGIFPENSNTFKSE